MAGCLPPPANRHRAAPPACPKRRGRLSYWPNDSIPLLPPPLGFASASAERFIGEEMLRPYSSPRSLSASLEISSGCSTPKCMQRISPSVIFCSRIPHDSENSDYPKATAFCGIAVAGQGATADRRNTLLAAALTQGRAATRAKVPLCPPPCAVDGPPTAAPRTSCKAIGHGISRTAIAFWSGVRTWRGRLVRPPRTFRRESLAT